MLLLDSPFDRVAATIHPFEHQMLIPPPLLRQQLAPLPYVDGIDDATVEYDYTGVSFASRPAMGLGLVHMDQRS
jgi:hypothetical protein